MSDLVPLGDLCRPKQWKTLSKSEMSEKGFVVYGANGPIGFADTYTHEYPTILIGCRGSCGTVVIAEPKAYANGNAMALGELDHGRVELRYLYHYLSHRGFRDVTTGTSQPQIIGSNLRRVEVLLPTLSEQRRIAAILDKTDALRAKRRETIAKLDQLLQSVFLDMFGDPAINPRGLPTATLEEVSDRSDRINYGVVQPGKDVVGGVPLVRIGDIEGGKLDAASIKRIDPKIESAYVRSRLKGNELLISCVGSIGTVATVPKEAIGFNIARAITRVPFKNPSQRAFFQSCLRSQGVQQYFQEKTRTVSQPTLNVEFVKKTQILVPPLEDQERFAHIDAQMEQRKSKMRESMSQLDNLFASLQHHAFTDTL